MSKKIILRLASEIETLRAIFILIKYLVRHEKVIFKNSLSNLFINFAAVVDKARRRVPALST